MSYLLPTRTETEICSGTFIEAHNFCKKRCCLGECKTFYENITPEDYDKFLICPHGMSVFVASNNGSPICFSCMRNREAYNKTLAKRIVGVDEVIYNPILGSAQLTALINYSIYSENENSKLSEKQASIESISHEVKKLNAQIKDRSDGILQIYGADSSSALSPQEMQSLLEKIKTIYICSSMVNTRFSLLNYEKNPESLRQGAKFDCNIYKKFDKMKIIFSNFLGRKVPIQTHGNSYKCFRAYPSFEMIPLLIIDNAVKYSYEGSNVTIDFNERQTDLIVSVSSYGPYCTDKDLSRIYTKGFRGENAAKTSDGSGIGLFFVKTLCDLHNIDILALSDSQKVTHIGDVAYAPFKIVLTFHETYLLNNGE